MLSFVKIFYFLYLYYHLNYHLNYHLTFLHMQMKLSKCVIFFYKLEKYVFEMRQF